MTDTIWIRSATHPDTGQAACLFDWGGGQALLTPETVLATARDLAAAAAAAETDIALVQALREDIRADDDVLAGLLTAVRARRPMPAVRTALRIQAVAGAKTGRPYVHIARGSMKAELTPDAAREMAGDWTQVAVAAQIDARLRYTLTGHPNLTPGDVNDIFEQLQSLQR
ncbi:hypothetical protein [Streptomyces antibioticus]|uniref:hypothetical protein n=1 Tax=Streptomyces antibioticus TaxID=1890 RepID=UPI003D73B76B